MRPVAECDVVIVGAGSAGCVLANRLSADPERRVLLLEAGPEDTRREVPIPAAWVSLFQSELDWNYETVPQQGLADRVIYWPRGKTLGGSSSINAQIYLRGDRTDFDEWKEAGNPGWGFDDVLPYFIKAEHNEHGGDRYHGDRGPLRVSGVRDPNPLAQAFLESSLATGLSRNDDFNGPRLDGIGYCQFTRHKGRRCSTSTAYLKPTRGRENLHVWPSTRVRGLRLDGRSVTGLICDRDGERVEVRARREVILSAGSVGSPMLLMHSGIGPPDMLRSLGIDVVHALPGVGRNLQDHVVAPMRFTSTRPVSLLKAKSLGNVVRYLVGGRGMLAGSGVDVLAHVRTRAELPAPDLQLLLMAVIWLDQGLREPTEHGFTLVAGAIHPKSRGYIAPRSNDPLEPPEIQPNYCTDEEGDDLRVLVEGLRMVRKIAGAKPFEELRGEEISPGPEVDSDEGLAEHVRHHAQTYYHPVGTCKMGTDPLAVVDPALRVRGLEGLRVVDASIMPTIPRANTNAATIMIGEKGADLILAGS